MRKIILALILISGCSNDSNNTSGEDMAAQSSSMDMSANVNGSDMTMAHASFNAPAIAPIVAAALPAALRPTTQDWHGSGSYGPTPHVMNTGNAADALSYIQGLFTEVYPNASGGNGIGYINSHLQDIDGRLQGIEMMAASDPHDCLNNTPKTFNAGDTSIDAMLTLPLNVQCTSAFMANGGGSDGGSLNQSGMVFGQDGNDYAIWMSLGPMMGDVASGGGFLSFANINNVGQTGDGGSGLPEDVDMMFFTYGPQYGDRVEIARIKAVPSLNTYEMFLASSQANVSGFAPADGGISMMNGADVYLGYGFRMISNGTLLYSAGYLVPQGHTMDSPTPWQAYEVCIDVSGTAFAVDNTAGDCDSLAASFTLNGGNDNDVLDYHTLGLTQGPQNGGFDSVEHPSSTVINKIVAMFSLDNADSDTTTF